MIELAKLPMVRRSLRNLFSRPATRRYPTEVRPPVDGLRGSIRFDLEVCNFCGLCAKRCPTLALHVSREERTFAIEDLRCITCGVCIDACKQHGLVMSDSTPRVLVTGAEPPEGSGPGTRLWQGEAPARPARAGAARARKVAEET
ncbi:MAG: 4Fe-4S binding protein [Actinomycetales bacterium]|nr:4Fe-4S binding protein [Actinomycetales bacterium]